MSAATTTAQAGPAWTYRAPHRPDGFENQCYYRVAFELSEMHDLSRGVSLFRFENDASAQIKLSRRIGMDSIAIEQTFDIAALRVLHAAIGDALTDIAAVEADRERQESFDRISEEMRDADEIGGPAVYYAHPDVHYVAPGQVEAKVRELEAAGCKRYIVLPDPQIVDATLEGAAA